MHQRRGTIGLSAVIIALIAAAPAFAQKQGGTLRMYIWDNPPSASIHEEATVSTVTPFMSLFNNLVLYDQHKRLNTTDNIRPELATSWAWNDDKTKLTFKLREGVKWHDGKPFTAKDVVCTLDKLQDKATDTFRKNPRKIWWHNLKEVMANGDHEVTFQLNRPQTSFLYLFATGYNPVYPCHVSAAEMRTKPIGTGPFKFVEFKSNESVKVVRNPDYWRKGHPYLDGIDWRVISNRSTRALAFVAGEFDMTFSLDLTVAITKDIQSQLPKAICELQPTNNSFNLIVNREVRAVQRSARSARRWRWRSTARPSSTSSPRARARSAASCWPAPRASGACRRRWSRSSRATAPTSRRTARRPARSWRAWATAPANPLKVKVSTRNIPLYRDPAVLLIDQLKQIHVEGELDVIDTSVWFAKVARGEYSVGMNLTGGGPRRSGRQLLRELCLRLGAQLHQVLQSGGGEADRPAIARDRSRQAQAAGVGGGEEARRGRGAADHHAGRRRPMLAALRQELRPAPQRHLQQLALRRRVAGQVAPGIFCDPW